VDSSDQLISLLRRCTVQLSTPSESGTGFFVAPGLILTCAHVVGDIQSNQTPVTVEWEDQTYRAKIMRLVPSPYPDLSLLELEDVLATHPCVLLHDAVQVKDELYSYGYTKNYSHGEPATFVVEGMTGDPVKLLKFKEGEAVFGFSGAPLLNLRTGCVCGVMSITRGQNTLMGGRGVPTNVVLEQFEELVTLQEEFHHKDRYWYDLLPESEVKKLNWQDLRAICDAITENRMSTVRDKYSEELYLQRDHAHQTFMRFLEDPTKRGFVLVGGSGVGKSNFLLAAREELQSREDVCVLMYDAASPMEYPLMEIINEDFHERMGWTTQRLWEKIKSIDGIDRQLVLLCVDSLNEHKQPRKLLEQLNDLIQRPWPWLKVVIVSRPEAWQFIKREITLASALYAREEDGAPGAILESFNYSERLEPFSRQELPLVYARYQHINQVQTPYEDLSSRLRDIISDPFYLWLVTRAYENKTIPENLKTTTLIEKYLIALIGEDKLQGGDPEWLKNQLVPLMVSEGDYDRVITSEELDAADHALCKGLLDRADSSGLPQLQSFRNLMDANILKREPHGLGFEISFKFDRFYDYFIGKRIFQISSVQADQYTYFLDIIERTQEIEQHFLWEAVRNTLVQEAEKPDIEIVLKLCRTPDQHIRTMMANVLITLGADTPQKVEGILKELVPAAQQVTGIKKVRQWLGKGTVDADRTTRNAGKIATEVASNLRIPWVLWTAALQSDSTIRTEAVRYAYMLWQRDQSKGFEILEYLTQNTVSGFLPNRDAFESCMGLSILIFFEHYQDRLVLARLQSIWREIIAKILRIRERSDGEEGVVRAFIRERIFSFVIKAAFQILHEFPDNINFIDVPALEAFFQRETTEKALYKNLTRYIDVQAGYSKEQMRSDFRTAGNSRDLLICLVANMGLIAHACYEPLAFLPFLKELLEEAKCNPIATTRVADIAQVTENALAHHPMSEELFDFFVYTVKVCHEYYLRYPQALPGQLSKAPEAAYLGPYMLYQYQRTKTIKTEWLNALIQKALLHNNIPFFDLLLKVELPFVGLEWEQPQIALEALTLFFDDSNAIDNAELHQMILLFLSRLRVHYSDDVDDFLEQQGVSEAIQLQVRTNEPVETIGELIGIRTLSFIRDNVVMGSASLRYHLIQILEKASDCTKIGAWFDYFIRDLINLIYGEEVLKQSANNSSVLESE
jgi:hypothetical protein